MASIEGVGPHLVTLFQAFPSGVSDSTRSFYLNRVMRAGIAPDDVEEAVERIIAARETRTVPPIGVLMRVCREVQGERSQTRSDKVWSPGEVRDLALRRLKLQELPPTEANIEREFAWIRRLGIIGTEVT